METWFLDIGQGTANVLLLGDRRAAVIDCGPAGKLSPLLGLLRHYADTIDLLAVSHNDADHRGGAEAVLGAYPKAIRRFLYVGDRPTRSNRTFRLLLDQRRRGLFTGTISPLVREEQGPRSLLPDPAHPLPTDLTLKLFAPTFFEAEQAQAARDANAASGVLVLDVGRQRIVFPGDASVGLFRTIHGRRGRPLAADLFVVPHHGGVIWPEGADPQRELRWLYSEGVRPEFAVVSVGSSNQHGHPRHEVIEALLNGGCPAILCTQLTGSCCDDPEAFRVMNPPPGRYCRSRRTRDLTAAGNSRNVACAGTVVAEVTQNDFKIGRLRDHQRAVDDLAAARYGHPMCRR